MGGKRQSSNAANCPKGVEIRDLGDGRTSLRIAFQFHGVRCRESLKLEATSAHIKFATNLRGEILNAIARGTFNYLEYFPHSKTAKKLGYTKPLELNPKIGDLLRDYLEQAEKTVEYSTYYGYKRKCERHLIPAFGDILIRDLIPATIREWIKGLKLTAKTVRNILTPFRSVIETALVDEIIDKNPLDKIVLSKLLDKKTRKSKYVVDPFDKKEIEAILNSAIGQIKNLFQFAFFTGLRTSELMALEWGDIDWINGRVYISRAIVYGRLKETKTAAGERYVLLLPPALDALKSQKAYTFLQNERVFHYPLKNTPWQEPSQIRQQAWLPLLRKAGVRYRNPYQTRHTYASMMLSNGENIMWVARQMGHKNTEMVMKTYGKWIPDSSITTGYKLVNDWANHIELKGEKCPNFAPLVGEFQPSSNNIYMNQNVVPQNLALPRGLEPLFSP